MGSGQLCGAGTTSEWVAARWGWDYLRVGSGQGVGPGLPESGQRPVRRTKFLIGYGPGLFDNG